MQLGIQQQAAKKMRGQVGWRVLDNAGDQGQCSELYVVRRSTRNLAFLSEFLALAAGKKISGGSCL